MGRPKVYESDADRVRAWREKRRQEAGLVPAPTDTSGPEAALRDSASMLGHLGQAQRIASGLAETISGLLRRVEELEAERDQVTGELADALAEVEELAADGAREKRRADDLAALMAAMEKRPTRRPAARKPAPAAKPAAKPKGSTAAG